MENVNSVSDCYGCGVCAVICPKKIISIELNKNGFYQPVIVNQKECTHCGLCNSVCAYSDNEVTLDNTCKIDCYAAWSNNEAIRNKCSSGGIAFELGQYLIKQGYKACGAKYNVGLNRVEHFIASDELEFQESIGSKYLQSYTLDAFKMFKNDEKYFVTGTPCQIDSLRRYIKRKKMEENFVLMDFFCHGVPSMLMWKTYLQYIEKKIGIPQKIFWRNKKFGWHDSWAISSSEINGQKEFYSSLSEGDLFYKMFLSDICLGKACYLNCKYKNVRSSADIRVGDLWGDKYKYDNRGVSGILSFTNKGTIVLKKLTDCTFIEEKINTITNGQIKTPPDIPRAYFFTLLMLRCKIPLIVVYLLMCKFVYIDKLIRIKLKKLFK